MSGPARFEVGDDVEVDYGSHIATGTVIRSDDRNFVIRWFSGLECEYTHGEPLTADIVKIDPDEPVAEPCWKEPGRW